MEMKAGEQTMRFYLYALICLLLFVSAGLVSAERVSDSPSVYLARYLETVDGRKILLSRGYVPRRSDRLGLQISELSYPQVIVEQHDFQSGTIVELSAVNKRDVLATLVSRNVSADFSPIPQKVQAATDELITLVDSGPSQNRIDFVFLGDGYIQAERGKFIRDMERLVKEMFADRTFRSYLPIFNVYAVFRPSAESGIGRGAPRDTAYGLYRPGDTLRAIYWTKATAARTSCHAAPDCDYPIIIANDPYYGGLGGEFAVSTSSPGSGTIVLRHELGHTVGRVGEEYDGGGYFGANHSGSRRPTAAW